MLCCVIRMSLFLLLLVVSVECSGFDCSLMLFVAGWLLGCYVCCFSSLPVLL